MSNVSLPSTPTRVRYGRLLVGLIVGSLGGIALNRNQSAKKVIVSTNPSKSCDLHNNTDEKSNPKSKSNEECKCSERVHILRKHSNRLSQDQAKAMAEYLVDNPYIHNGYREPGRTWRECVESIFDLHNETFNVWSHGVAFVYFARAAVVRHRFPEKLFAFNAAITFGISSIAHTFHCHSEDLSHKLFVCDRASIANLFFASAVSSNLIHFRLPNQLKQRIAGIVTAAVFYFGTAYSIALGGQKLKLVLMLAAQAGTIIGVILRELAYATSPVRKVVLKYTLRTICFAIGGASIFVAHFPERYFPGWFCYMLHSHNLMHVLVAIGTGQLLEGLRQWSKSVNY